MCRKKQELFLQSRMDLGGSDTVGTKRAGSGVLRLTWHQHVLKILTNDDTISSDAPLKLVASKIDPMKAQLVLREIQCTTEGRVLIFADSIAYLQRLVIEADRSDLEKDPSVLKLGSAIQRLLPLMSTQTLCETK